MITDTHVLSSVSIVFQDYCMTSPLEYFRHKETNQVNYVQTSKFRPFRLTIVTVKDKILHIFSVCLLP